MSGSTIGGFVGGAIGFYFGGPQGAQIGFMLGSAIGGYVDPEHIKGPSLGDIPIQTSQEGVPRPIVYGAPQPFGGNIIQIGQPQIVPKEEQQGKGGGPVVESDEVYQTYAIRICEGPATVLTIWREGKVIYDRTGQFAVDADSAAFASRAIFYTGDETQLPDGNLEALPSAYGGGVGNVPAYRGTAYMVVVNDNLTQFGGRIPQYQFRMASDATVSESCTEDGLIFWYPLDDASPGGTAREIVGGWDGTYSNNIDPVTAQNTVSAGPSLNAASSGSCYFSGFGGYMKGPDFEVPSMSGYSAWTVSCWFSPQLYEDANGGGTVLKAICSGHTGNFIDGSVDWGLRLRYPSSPAEEKNLQPTGVTNQSSMTSVEITDSDLMVFGRKYYMVMTFAENPTYAPGRGDLKLTINGALVAEANDVSNSGSATRYVLAGGGYSFSSSYQFIGYVSDVKGYNYALTLDEINDKYLYSEEWLELPDAPGNYVNTITNEVQRMCTASATTNSVFLSTIESDIAQRCDIDSSQIDVAADTAVEVEGFLVAKQMPGADAMRALGQVYFRDYPEYDLKIHSTPRGLPSVVSLTDDDFVDREEDEETRAQAIELPRKLNLYFCDPAASFAIVPVPAERTSVDIPSTSVVAVQAPLVLNRDDAARRADIMLKCVWEESQGTLKRELPGYQFAYLTAADAVNYSGKRWRIDKLDQLDGTIKIEARRDRINNYTSNATANTTQTPTTPITNSKGPTLLKVMNLPSLRSQDTQSGVYVAVTGLLTGWPGAYIYLSVDGGLTEQRVATITARATMGKLAASCTSSSEPITVKLNDSGTLETITDAQLAARQNGFAITSSGVSEVGQFKTATASGSNWDLTDVSRGQLNTTAASHAVDDDFVLLDGAVVFIPIDSQYAGETLIFRGVTRGTAIENNPTVSIVFDPAEIIVDGGEVTP